MKRTGLLLITGAIVALTVLYVGAAAPTSGSKSSSEIAQLKKEVADLRQRVEFLEERMKDDLVPANVTDGKERPDVIRPYPGQRRLPESWKRGEFNGIPYYIVPLDSAHKPANTAPTQVQPEKSPAAPQTPDNSPKP